jgi:hypothetical protein
MKLKMEYQIPQIKVIQLKHVNPILAGSATGSGDAGSDTPGVIGSHPNLSKRSIFYDDYESSSNQGDKDLWSDK